MRFLRASTLLWCWKCLSRERERECRLVLNVFRSLVSRSDLTAVGKRHGARVLAGASTPGSSRLHAARRFFFVDHSPNSSPHRLRCRRCRRRRRPRPPPRRQSAISPALRSTRLCESGRRPPWPCPWRCPRAHRRTGPPSAGRSFPWLNEEEERDGERKRRRRRCRCSGFRRRRRSLFCILFRRALALPLFLLPLKCRQETEREDTRVSVRLVRLA